MTESCLRLFRDESAARFRDEIQNVMGQPPAGSLSVAGRGERNVLVHAVAELFELYEDPSIEVRNRVWTVSDVSHRVPLNILMCNHRELDTKVAENLLKLEWRGKRCVRVEHGKALIHIWLNSDNRFRGGMLVDFEVPGIGHKKCHAKIYNNSETIQLFGCGIRAEYAMHAYAELKNIMGRLHPSFSNFASGKMAVKPDFKCINENSRINLGVRVDDMGRMVRIIQTDWLRHHEDEKVSVFTDMESVRAGRSRMYVTVAAENHRAVVTLFESGRGHISARTSQCRLLAWCVILKLVDMYGAHFTRTCVDRNKEKIGDAYPTTASGKPRRHTPQFSAHRTCPYSFETSSHPSTPHSSSCTGPVRASD